jgi:hypothetical protein
MVKEIQQRTFNYVDAMPGSGKTEYFVSKALQLLRGKQADHGLIYVAPTIRLLIEAYTRIKRHPQFKKGVDEHLITIVATPTSLASSGLDCATIDERPRQVLNYLFGLSASCGRVPDDLLPERFGPGKIILTTHEAFVQVSHKDPTGGDFAILKKSHVIFDEARHCVLDSRALKDVSNESLLRLRMCFDLTPTKLPDGVDPDSNWHLYEISGAPSQAHMKEVFRVRDWRTIPSSLRTLRKAVSVYTDSGRASLFLMTNVKLATLLDSKNGHATVAIYTLLRPTGLFNHYARVTLTSAFFKDSQMFHFLKSDGHHFKDLRQSKDPHLRSIYVRDQSLRESLSKRLLVGALVKEQAVSSKRGVYRNNLTSNLLDSGLVYPTALTKHLSTYLNPSLTSTEIINNLISGRPVSNNKKFQKALSEYAAPPLWVLIREAASVLSQAWTSGDLTSPSSSKDHNNLALMVLNVRHKVWGPRYVPYMYTIRTLYEEGSLVNRHSSSRDFDAVHSSEKSRAIEATPKYWSATLSDHLFVRSPNRKFIIPQSNRLHGINLYSGVNAFVHLAALNPTPQLIAFYKILLGPDYDIDQDHSIENLVQMLYRTSLRTVGATQKVLMIVPYRAQAELLQTKIGCGSFQYINKPRLAVWDYRKPTSPEDLRRITRKATEAATEARLKRVGRFRPEDAKEVHSARVSISRYRRRIKNEPDNPNRKKWEEHLRKFMSRLEDLKV